MGPNIFSGFQVHSLWKKTVKRKDFCLFVWLNKRKLKFMSFSDTIKGKERFNLNVMETLIWVSLRIRFGYEWQETQIASI